MTDNLLSIRLSNKGVEDVSVTWNKVVDVGHVEQ
jgi:hypothetical protein